LTGNIGEYLFGHVQRIRQEHSQEPHCSELDPEAQPIVIAPALLDECPISVVEEEEALQLCA
jgi:hypothetical protein